MKKKIRRTKEEKFVAGVLLSTTVYYLFGIIISNIKEFGVILEQILEDIEITKIKLPYCEVRQCVLDIFKLN